MFYIHVYIHLFIYTHTHTPAAFHVWAGPTHIPPESGLAGAAVPGLSIPPLAKPVHSTPAQGMNMEQIVRVH